ncbi:hypothetical protein LOC68_22965 [Blastopirellula sp. JC732]|uniref:Uncharacterized protein n=1 Tax=Blastopirellula sediminis TaxID=2894196 RepID=A0A9X1MRY5_9BACT|nr:hypothetical protein [Blastopirellula sediminis]MCC9605435.1 hypothetical protein [Blastopirellula sediminis]MCC9631265.1 hypothetical protein [Blastopirellula sediminis]
MSVTNSSPRRGMSPSLFILAQVVLLATLSTGIAWALSSDHQASVPSLPRLRNAPELVGPQYDMRELITDDQLRMVLVRLRPRLRHQQPKINHVDHALRFWGADAKFADPECLSGEEMRRMLTNMDVFHEYWGDATRDLITPGESGWGVRTQQGAATASHVDHTLGTLAEIGTPLDFPIKSHDATLTVRDLLVGALRDFRLNQQEYEWTTIAAASYAADDGAWVSREGERITFDQLAQRIMRQQWVQGVCYGNHRLFTLAALLRLDEQVGLFQDAATRDEIIAHLTEATRRLVASQNEAGYWDQNWYDGTQTPVDEGLSDPLSRRLLATGHALEWWAISPAEVQPPRETKIRAGQWLATEVEKMSDDSIRDNYTFLSHVGRALALWRGALPADQWSRLECDQALQINATPAGENEDSPPSQ